MAAATEASNPILRRLGSISDSDAVMGIGIVVILSVMLLPMPAPMLDVFLAANLGVALTIILTTVYVVKAVDFTIFPSLLLVTTLFRLSLAVAARGWCFSTATRGPRRREESSMPSAASW